MSTILDKLYAEQENAMAERLRAEKKLAEMLELSEVRQLRKERQRFLNYYAMKHGRHPNSYEISIIDSIFFNESLTYIKNLVKHFTESLCATTKE